MAKPHEDQVNWPYAPPHFYAQPRTYNIPYPQGRVCQESCCRRSRGPIPYPHPLPPLPPPLPCRSSQDNAYARPQPPPQIRGFVPVNPYLQQHGSHPQHTQAAVHRPIPQGRYDYNDFYRFGNSANNNNTNNHQSFHPTVLKQNTSTYGVNNPPHVTEQYPACSHYTPQEQESTLPSLDVRQFLATWQDKDDEVFESDQQQKSKVPYQEPPPNPDVFKPLDCSKRTDPTIPMYGYNHNQINGHPAYYNKSLQGVTNHQSLNETAFKNPPYITNNSYHPVPVDTDCNYTNSQVTLSPHGIVENDPQHVGYERRIEKIFNPHGCKGMPAVSSNDQSHCAIDKGNHNIDIKAPPLTEKTQYHLSASLECEDLFDDINRKKEERQRNIVHPLCYQESYSQRLNGSICNKPDVPRVSVKPNNSTHLNFSIDNFESHTVGLDGGDLDLKKPKAMQLKKWVQKRKKSDDEFFPSFGINDPTLDFSSRETVIERSHITPPCSAEIPLPVNENNSCNTNIISDVTHVPSDPAILANDGTIQNYSSDTNNSDKPTPDCVYGSLSGIAESEPQTNGMVVSPTIPSQKAALIENNNQPSSIQSDDIDINIPSSILQTSCSLDANEEPCIDQESAISPYQIPETKHNESLPVAQAMEKTDDLKTNYNVPTEDSLDAGKPNDNGENEIIDSESKELQDEHGTSSTNALETIAYMYNDENNVSENSVDSSQTESKPRTLQLCAQSKYNSVSSKFPFARRNRTVNILNLWRYRNRLFPKSLPLKKLHSINKSKSKAVNGSRCLREFSKFCLVKKKKSCGFLKTAHKLETCSSEDQTDVVNIVLASIVDGVCQFGEASSQKNDLNEIAEPPKICTPIDNTKINAFDGNSNVVCWEFEGSGGKTESDITEDSTNLVIREEYIGYAEGSVVDTADDRVLHGILNWPHHEEEITSINEKESIKVSLPWVKIFKPHSDLPDGEKTLEIGPARIELRYSSAPVEYQPGHYKASRSPTEKKSSIFSVKKVLLKHNSAPPTERLPKMVIKKTGCEEYKSYIKDAKLRVISIKNSNKDGQAEVIIESDRPLIETLNKCDATNDLSELDSPSFENVSGNIETPENSSVPELPESSLEENKELHHCLLCQESFNSIDKLHNHENSLSHRHIDIIQRSVLHKLQSTIKGIDLPAFQPLSATEIEYLNWRPNFPGYNHFYHNVPL